MKNPESIGERVVDHLTKTEGGSVPEDPDMKEWIQATDENRKTYHDFKQIWQGARLLGRFSTFDPLQGWNTVNKNIKGRQRKIRYLTNAGYVASGIAASVILLLVLHFFTPLFSNQDNPVVMSTDWGNRSEVMLPDGSRVKLNSGSKLTYHYNSSKKIREVKFSGEGFFAVSKSKHPFIIKVPDGLELKVLGTKFNLYAYTGDKISQTALIEGKVELITDNHKALTLAPGQVAAFNSTNKQLALVSDEPAHLLSWMDNKLYMDNMSLQEVCTRLERWYDVHIEIRDQAIADRIHYTGVLSEETIVDVLDALCELSTIQYRMKGKNIVITKK